MREQLKQQFREMLATLGTAEGILDSKSKKKDGDAVHQLLEDMQNSAIAIGTAIEAEEGNGTQAVKRLEEYCELLWQYLIAEELKERFRIGRQLTGKRSEISALLETEITGYLEVVFLACKADNWQYLEPFWELFKEHANCCCRVLTAPYHVRMDGRAIGIVHDESGMFPQKAEVTDYESYELETLKPDLVFVDGPWSQGTAPEYHYKNVREAAGTLIYVPGDQSESLPDRADCMLPQVETADLVILPTTELCQFYKAELRKDNREKEPIRKLRSSESVRTMEALLKGIRNQ
ncbi:MAG: hypothetical protein ACRDBO_04290 [Lachnospiraceae bacterium]